MRAEIAMLYSAPGIESGHLHNLTLHGCKKNFILQSNICFIFIKYSMLYRSCKVYPYRKAILEKSHAILSNDLWL